MNAMMTVRDVMTTKVVSVHRATPLKDVARLLIDNGISGVPVVDPFGAVVGVVSEGDLVAKEQGIGAVRRRPLARVFGDSAASRATLAKVAATTAGDAMTAPAVTITPTTTIADAAIVMTRRRVNRLPVVDDDALVGIVTRSDLVRAFVRDDEQLAATIREDVIRNVMWLDPAGFDVVVDKGIVQIAGHVEQRTTAQILERVAAMVPGIVDVRAHISWTVDDTAVRPPAREAVFPFGA